MIILVTIIVFFQTLGTAACPPYHLAVVIGGTSAEFNLKTVKLASARYLDNLPSEGLYIVYFTTCDELGGRRGRERMVVGFTTTCAMSAYHQ